jgi:hypothetical protein
MAEPDTAVELPPEKGTEPSEPGMGDIFGAATTRAYGTAHRENPIPEIKGDEDYATLKPGTKFMGPDKKVRTKPWEVASDEDYDVVPEGADFVDPKGQTRIKPKAGPISYTAQTLYDMARTDGGREQALRKLYGDQVKRDSTGALYIEDEDGKLLRPGRGAAAFFGNLTAEAAPSAGMILGGRLGGAIGTGVEPGGGTIAGGVGGAVLGAMAGRQVNNVVLGLAGIHEGLVPQAESLASEATGVMGGELIGRGLAKIPAAIAASKRTAQQAGAAAGGLRENLPNVLEQAGITPDRARKFMGTSQESAQRAAQITEEGGRVPPSVLAPEAPFLKKIEEFDSVFRAQNVFGQANEKYYNEQVRRILEDKEIGISLEDLATRATKKVSSEHAGQVVLEAARKDMAAADAQLENAVRDLKAQAAAPIEQAGGAATVAQNRQLALERLHAAQTQAKQSAENVIQEAMRGLRVDVQEAMRMVGDHEDPSALIRKITAEFNVYNQGIRQRAKLLYNAADEAAGGATINTSELAEDADAFLKTMPETLRQKYPSEINQLKKLAPQEGQNEEFEPLTFGQLHHLRSWFRYGIDYADLTPDMKGGALKHFEKKINAVLHDAEAPPELRTAARMLDEADGFYKQNIPFLSDEMMQGTVNLLRSGAGVNAEEMASRLFDPNRTVAMRKVRGIVGENMWKAVQAANVRGMLDDSRIIGTDQFDASKFAKQVAELNQNGLLSTAYDEMTAKRLTKIATDVGRLNGSIPLSVEPGDTITSLMRRAQLAAEQIEKFADQDPIKALAAETKRLDQQYIKALRENAKSRRADPLHFLYEDSMSALAVRSADRILSSQDLIMAAATKFGRESPEFNALRQVYAARFFQRPFGRTAKLREELGGEKGMTEEVQALMFPGVTRKQMNDLAGNMEFLFSGGGSDIGGSMAAASRVLHPEQNIPIPHFTGIAKYIMPIPGVSAATRFALGKYFALIMDATSHPNFINWLAGRLEGDEFARAEARAVVQNRLRLGGWFGRAAGQQIMNQPSQDTQDQAVQ